MNSMPQTIMITGPLGYVGGSLVPYIRSHFPGARLVGVDNGWFSDCKTVTGGQPEDSLDKLVLKDIRTLEAADLVGVDCIVHLAAVSNDPMGQLFEAATRAINYEATIELARLARSAGVGRFVLASSCSVYGAGPDEAIDENGQLNPLTAYARSKVESELALKDLAAPDFLVTCLRFGTACGFSPRTRLDLVVNDFVASAVACGEVRLLSTGNAWRPFIHIEDMARAVEWAMIRDGHTMEIVNVGSEAMTAKIGDLARQVTSIVPDARTVVADGAAEDARTYQVSFDRFMNLAPDHQPQWTMEATVSQLYEGFRSVGFCDANFRQGQFIRLNRLRQMMEAGEVDNLLFRQSGMAA